MAILGPIYQHDGDRIAVQAGDTAITYRRFCADVDSMARWLIGNGLEPGARISIHVKNIGQPRYWDWVAHLGAIRAGLGHSTGLPPAPVAQSGALGRRAAAIGYELAKVPGQTALKLPFDPQDDSAPLSEQLTIDDGVAIDDDLEKSAIRFLSTSGTTGSAKVLAWDRDMIERRNARLLESGVIDASTRLLPILGYPTTAGFRFPLATWHVGGTVILPPTGKTDYSLVDLGASSNLVISSAFRLGQTLDKQPREWENKEARKVMLFGGRVPPALRDNALRLACGSLVTNYGSTEAGNIASGDASLIERHPGAAGIVRSDVTVEIVDGKGSVRPAGQEGIIRLKTDTMCEGYLGPVRQGSGKSPFRDGWFYPGDLGFVDEDGMLAITGRTSETINIGGSKVSTAVLETKLEKLPGVRETCLISMALPKGDTLVVAAVCNQAVDLAKLRQQMQPHIPRALPWKLVRVPKIPRNQMGKPMRKKLAKILSVRTPIARTGALQDQ